MDRLKITKVDSVLIQGADQSCRFATLHLTPHHLIFTFNDSKSPSSSSNPHKDDPSSSSSHPQSRDTISSENELWISYSLLSLVVRLPSLSPIKIKSHPQSNTTSNQDPSSSFPPQYDNRNQSSSNNKSSLRTLKNTSTHSHSNRIYPLSIKTRLFKSYAVGFNDENSANDVFESIKNCRQISSINQLYAFYYNPTINSSPSTSSFHQPSPNTKTYQLYDFKQEFTRQGVGTRTKAWRYCDLNLDYDFSPTYPSTMIIPSRISDTTLRYGSKYRSKLRLPALSYLHWANLGSITRSSQPMVGLKQNRSIQDEKLIEAIFESHLFSDPSSNLNSVAAANALSNNGGGSSNPSSSTMVYGATTTNLIIDARPTTNAVANVAKGAGTENMDHYKGCKKVYLGVENIHVMRDSLNKVVEILNQNDKVANFGLGLKTGEIESDSSSTTTLNHSKLTSSDLIGLKKSNWLKHISSLLEGSLLITKNIHINSSHVLIHCSDGWDRTSQLSCVSQILLDPYFRTMKGLSVLIEKDWCSFGHRFTDRCGHLGGVAKFQIVSDNQEDELDEDEEDENGIRRNKENDLKEEETSGGFEQQAAQAFWGFTKQLQAGFQNVSNSNSNSTSSGASHIKETSPVFHQFLDCIWQVMEMYPNRFQFNELWLRELLKRVYSCQNENFLFNNEKERKLGSSGNQTRSLWDEILLSQEVINTNFDKLKKSREVNEDAKDEEKKSEIEVESFTLHQWLNPSYDPSLDDPKRSDTDMGVLLPNPKQVKFWYQLFGREDSDMNSLIYAEEEERLRKKEEALRVAEREREKAETKRKEEEELTASNAADKALREAQLLDDGSVGALGPTVEGSKDDPLIGQNDNVEGSVPGTIRSGAVDLSTSRFDSNKLSYKPRNRPSIASRLSAVTSNATSTTTTGGPSSKSSSSSSLLQSPSSSTSSSSLPPAPISSTAVPSSKSISTNLPDQSNPWSNTTPSPASSSSNLNLNFNNQSGMQRNISPDPQYQDPWQAQQAAAAEAANNLKKMFAGGWGRLTEAVNGVSSPSPSSSTSNSNNNPTITPSTSGNGSGFLSLQDAEPLKQQDFRNGNHRPALRQSDAGSISSNDRNHKGDLVVNGSKTNMEGNLKNSGMERNHWSMENTSKNLDDLTLGNEKPGNLNSNSKTIRGYGYGGLGGEQISIQNQNQNQVPTTAASSSSSSSFNSPNNVKTPTIATIVPKKEEETKSETYDPLGVGL